MRSAHLSLFLFAFALVCTIAPVAHAQATSTDAAAIKDDATLLAKYAAAGKGGPKINILIVPGHEPDYGGAVFQNLYERDIAVAIANNLATDLKKNPRFNVIVARDTTAWNSTLQSYFDTNWSSIQAFIQQHKNIAGMSNLLAAVGFQVSHNTAAVDPATRLYGISKWADENNIDMAIHVHLNDAADHTDTEPGNHSGFAVYVPDIGLQNGIVGRVLGMSLANELNRYNATSTLPVENLGVVGDKELIALGAYNTAKYPSVLIEYAYIYEPKVTTPTVLPTVEKDLAFSTYRGVQDFFNTPLKGTDSAVLPHTFTASPKIGSDSGEVYTLQAALHKLGFYPANGDSLYDCPVGSVMGPCTVNAIKAFQASKKIEQTGTLGPMTRKALNLAIAKK